MSDPNPPNPGPTPTATVINVEHTQGALPEAPAAAPHSAHDAMDKTQEALRRLDEALAEKASASIVTPVSEVEPPAQSLSEADESLAQDLDQIMQGDAATVNAVLDDVFKEQAAVVQQLDESPRAAEPPVAAVPQVLAAPLTAPMATVDEPAPAAPALANIAGAPAPISAPASNPDGETAAPLNPIAAAREQSPVAPSPSSVAIPEPTAAPVETASVSAAASVASVHTENAAEPASQSKAGALNGVLAKLRFNRPQGLASLLDPIVNVLVIINSPLRRVPASLRPMVDWLALSLLAWVPIVWVLAIFLGNKSAPPAPAALKEDGIVLPTLHEESTNAGSAKH